MTLFRTTPTYTEPLQTKGKTTASWYRWFQTYDMGFPPSSEMVISEHVSPFTFQAPRGGCVIVFGGTVSLIQLSRTPGKFYSTGQTAGMFPLSANDQIKIVFSAKPALTWVPQ